jgi:monovalent cation:H+ antiporter, CPA1 family
MPVYNLITIIVVLTALFGYINHRFIKLPSTIGIMLISLTASLVVIALGNYNPGFFTTTRKLIKSIDFNTALMDVMLSFLLFAGAIHLDVAKLRQQRGPIIIFSTLGTLLSTFIVGALFYYTTSFFKLYIDFIHCLLFGSLISPTDPIAVLGIMRKANMPNSLETKITGESLFNDGVAVVIFITIMEVISNGPQYASMANITWLFVRETGGGIVLGVILGYAGFWLLKSIDNYIVEVGITLAIVMGGYTLANNLHVSGPLAMVIAGIITGNKSWELSMSETTRDYLDKFWEMIDEFLNGILFLLIGFEMLVIHFNTVIFWIGCVTILIVLFARFVSVAIPIAVLKFGRTFEKHAISILTWGGLRGGISVALALSIPHTGYRYVFVAVTYIIVLFSIIVQGLTIGKLAKRLHSD